MRRRLCKVLFLAHVGMVVLSMLPRAWLNLVLMAYRYHGKLYVGDSIAETLSVTFSGPKAKTVDERKSVAWWTPLEAGS